VNAASGSPRWQLEVKLVPELFAQQNVRSTVG
jgi:hypothetical protein